MRDVAQLGVQVAVGVGRAQGREAEVAASHRGVDLLAGAVVRAAVGGVGGQGGRVVDAAAEVAHMYPAVALDAEDERDPVGVHGDDLGRAVGAGGSRGGAHGGEERQKQFFHGRNRFA